ncbi:MAG: hypothetical protein MJB14_16780 [Spirochaetes bacterium]|nr:hypothetical protein [Spirochaetota bacterium]
MYSEVDKQKMTAFIKRLMLNPCFINETPLHIEENIILFFMQNYNALQTTFSSGEFFPNLKWEIIYNLFFTCLAEEINRQLDKTIEKIVFKYINFQFMNNILNRQIETIKFREDMLNYLKIILERFDIRRTIDPVFKIITHSIIDKYAQQIYEKKSYTAREIERVEGLKLSPEHIADFIKVDMLFGVLGFIRNDVDAANLQHKMASLGEMKFSNLQAQISHYKKILDIYDQVVPLFPRNFMDKSLKMHFNFQDDPFLPATSRLAKIFYAFGKHYKANIKIDKGAETFGKSFFQIQRRNYKFYGFDNNVLDELYRISAENYW